MNEFRYFINMIEWIVCKEALIDKIESKKKKKEQQRGRTGKKNKKLLHIHDGLLDKIVSKNEKKGSNFIYSFI